MIALFLSLGLIVIAFVQITESKGDLAPLAGFGFILPSGITVSHLTSGLHARIQKVFSEGVQF